MRAKLTAAEYEALRAIVMREWDPIGVHVSECDESDRSCYWDEYDNYLPKIVGLLREGDVDRLVDYLSTVRTDFMGLELCRDLDTRAAHAILDWFATSA